LLLLLLLLGRELGVEVAAVGESATGMVRQDQQCL